MSHIDGKYKSVKSKVQIFCRFGSHKLCQCGFDILRKGGGFSEVTWLKFLAAVCAAAIIFRLPKFGSNVRMAAFMSVNLVDFALEAKF